MRPPDGRLLQGHGVRLEPLAATHVDHLADAALADPQVWTWLAARPRTAEDVASLVAAATADPGRTAYAVVVDGRAQGSTSVLDVDPAVGGLEVGGTWYSRPLWATRVNPACKLLLLGHAFDDLGAQRVTLKTDARNERSRAAIARLGCRYDGTLRHHRSRPDGTVRDSAYYSLLAAEWPAARDGLLQRLS